ncbi:unnamed protein product, partial [Laminaria digitata]
PFVEGLPSTPKTNSNTTDGIICWETQGLHESDCFHAENLTTETYPLTQEMLERASSRYTTTDLSLNRAFQRSRKRGVLKVVVVGGSVTYGHECVSPAGLKGVECAWPHRLQQWFDERVEDVPVEVVNAAKPASSILDLLHNGLHDTLPVDLEVDLIIVDYGVNDAVFESFDFDINNVKLAHEVFILHVRNDMLHMPALLYAESFISPARVRQAPHQKSNMAEVHAEATKKYDIPMASFRDAVWPDDDDSALAERVWGNAVHPDWQVHQLLADVMVYFIQKSYARFLEEHGLLSEPSLHEQALSLYATNVGCMAEERSFDMNTGHLEGHPPPEELVEAVGWSFFKDASGKRGLIGYGGNSTLKAIVSFDIPCAGERGVLDIGYLKSYTDMGAVLVTIRGAGIDPDDLSTETAPVVIDGLWVSRASVEDYAAIPIPSGFDTVRVTFEVLSVVTEPLYSDFLSGVAGTESDGVRKGRKFLVERMQCC